MYDSLNYITTVGIELAIVCMVIWMTKQGIIAVRLLVKMFVTLEKRVEELNKAECTDNV